MTAHVITRIVVSSAVVLVTACHGNAATERPPIPRHPNILLIVLDTVRYDATPADPTSSNPMPFFAQLVRAGVNFTNSYSTYDSTPESHFSMLTGFHAGFTSHLDAQEHSVPYHLRKLGYKTFGIAANGNLSQSTCQVLKAFEQYTCLMDVWDSMPPEQQTKQLAWIDPALEAYGVRPNEFNRLMRFSSAPEVMSRFSAQIASVQSPFFGFINLVDAHDPYIPDPRHYNATERERKWAHKGFNSDLRSRKLPPGVREPWLIADEKRREAVLKALTKTSMTTSYRAWGTTFDLSAEALEIYRSRYRAAVQQLDAVLRDVFATLEHQRLLDSTIVIVTSDHGEAFGEQDLITHSFLNRGDREATNRVPLVIVFPTVYGFGARTVTAPVVISDIAPTIYDLLGLEWSSLVRVAHPGNFGKSLLPFLGGTFTAADARPIEIGDPAVTEMERERARRESENRLRSLGYINR